jgi:hypothetical protein
MSWLIWLNLAIVVAASGCIGYAVYETFSIGRSRIVG